ncbi:V-type proton ATPase subunit F [Tetrabaena socialis]|uniref:V-type proton ATPase subunit F n=1 Tax=Tetrabaena socialis TaxID=47790 RepID=A0A2J7ZVC6_9CHLO|nr:V-type proton ATPase subunit F [Tetrabaena socialis]|eukprot:PNH04215.1 V-type proton ATPase subunit F [Tetrabaena socialis]
MAASAISSAEGMLLAVLADEDTITGFLLAGVGNVDMRKKRNYLVVDSKTSPRQIEQAFKEFAAREDIAVILISQQVAGHIRHIIEAHNKPIPAVLEIPSKDCPYDPSQDSLLTRVKHIAGFN